MDTCFQSLLERYMFEMRVALRLTGQRAQTSQPNTRSPRPSCQLVWRASQRRCYRTTLTAILTALALLNTGSTITLRVLHFCRRCSRLPIDSISGQIQRSSAKHSSSPWRTTSLFPVPWLRACLTKWACMARWKMTPRSISAKQWHLS